MLTFQHFLWPLPTILTVLTGINNQVGMEVGRTHISQFFLFGCFFKKVLIVIYCFINHSIFVIVICYPCPVLQF